MVELKSPKRSSVAPCAFCPGLRASVTDFSPSVTRISPSPPFACGIVVQRPLEIPARREHRALLHFDSRPARIREDGDEVMPHTRRPADVDAHEILMIPRDVVPPTFVLRGLLFRRAVEPPEENIRIRPRSDQPHLAVRLQRLLDIQRPHPIRVIREVSAAPYATADLSLRAAGDIRLRAVAEVVRARRLVVLVTHTVAGRGPLWLLGKVLRLPVKLQIVEKDGRRSSRLHRIAHAEAVESRILLSQFRRKIHGESSSCSGSAPAPPFS